MNTGMQDAINLAWKMALVCRGTCMDSLLDSYSPERSEIGEQVVKGAGRMTALAVLKNPVGQAVRNFAARLLLGLSPAVHVMAETITELSIGYKHSPLNGTSAHLSGVQSLGSRFPVTADMPPIGAGDTPRWALLAAGDSAQALADQYPDLLEPTPRTALEGEGVCLVRPDGYVACTCGAADLRPIADYLARLTGNAAAPTL